MMKIVVIGDIHGRDKWKQQVQEPADMYVFIGDYFDSFTASGDLQIENFKDILEFRKQNEDRVILLSGNHDCINYHAPDFEGRCSGFQAKNAVRISELIQPLRQDGTLQACKVIGKYLFSHAGVTKTWCEKYNIDTSDIENEINSLFKETLEPFYFQEPYKMSMKPSPYGDDIYQGPMWVRPYSLIHDRIDGFTQVVGHTQQKNVAYNSEADIYFTDCQEMSNDFLKLKWDI